MSARPKYGNFYITAKKEMDHFLISYLKANRNLQKKKKKANSAHFITEADKPDLFVQFSSKFGHFHHRYPLNI